MIYSSNLKFVLLVKGRASTGRVFAGSQPVTLKMKDTLPMREDNGINSKKPDLFIAD